MLFGGQKLQMQVIADRERLAAYRMSLLDLKSMLDMQNQSKAGGDAHLRDREVIVRTDLRARTPEEVANYPIASMDGRTVYLKDVAEVVNAPREQRSLYRFNGKEAVELADHPAAGGQLGPRDRGRSGQAEGDPEDFPGLKFEVAYDNATFVGFLMDNMVEELVLADPSHRPRRAPLPGEPARHADLGHHDPDLAGAWPCWPWCPFGMTLNSSTLIGLLLSIGRLVDDSIIDIHAIERHLRMGKSPKDAAVDGISEVRLAVLATTFMVCVALLPLAFSGGIVQLMFEGIVWPIIFGLLASALVSFTLTALLAANLFRSHQEQEAARPDAAGALCSWTRASAFLSGWRPGTAGPWAGASGTASRSWPRRRPSSSWGSRSTRRSAAR